MINTAHFKDQSVCVLGLGYVGLTLATVMAEVGFDVLGVEIRDDVLEKLKQGEPHFFEPELNDRLKRVVDRKKFQVAKKIPEGCKASVYIITVGTPLGPNGKPRLDMIENVAREICEHSKPDSLVILRSTVMVGTTRNTIAPILKSTGKNFDLAFCPERTLEGQALKELRELPQIVGGFTQDATIRASQLFQMLTSTVVKVSSPESAEMIKLVDNTQRDVIFAFANEIARLSDAAGINAMEVISAGKLGYPRTNLPMPGPVGGPCLEKDTHILAESFAKYGIKPDIAITARALNFNQPEEVIKQLSLMTGAISGFSKNPVISILGLAFKGRPATDDTRGTMAKPIFAALKKYYPGARFVTYDPLVTAETCRKEFLGLEPLADLQSAFQQSSLTLILNNHPVFSSMPIESLSNLMAKPSVIYDFWNNFTFRDLHLSQGVTYSALGFIQGKSR